VEYLYNTDKNVWSLHLFNGIEVPLSLPPDKILELFNPNLSSIRKTKSLNSKVKANTNKALKTTGLEKADVSKTINNNNNIEKQQDNKDDYIIINL
jgi:hypothetical protein